MLDQDLNPIGFFFLLVKNKGVSIMENYDKQSLFPMFLKSHHVRIHLMAKFKSMANQLND
jgi:hypothetical protein